MTKVLDLRRSTSAWFLALGLIGLPGDLFAQSGPKPLDPLTPAEIQNARGIASIAPVVTGRIAGRRYILGSVGFLPPPKPADSSPPADGRYAEVLYCVYADNTGVRALVDVARGTVWSSEEVSCEQVPIAPEEVQTARDLAVANPDVRNFLGGTADLFQPRRSPDDPMPEFLVEALKVVAPEDGDRCFGQRCVILLFSDAHDYRAGLEVLVNLTSLTVTTTPVAPEEWTSTHSHREKLKAGKTSKKTKASGRGSR